LVTFRHDIATGSSTIGNLSLPTRRQIGLRRLQEKLHEIGAPAKDLSGSEELETILPLEDRQTTWRELQAGGFKLPELQVSPTVFWIAAALVLTPLGLLVLALQTWFAIFTIVELTFLAYKLTRPLAIHPPQWCRTVGQAALCLGNVLTPDGRIAAWTREEIAERVRMIIAQSAGLPIQKVTESARLTDLLGC
jgi:hypothetical protein